MLHKNINCTVISLLNTTGMTNIMITSPTSLEVYGVPGELCAYGGHPGQQSQRCGKLGTTMNVLNKRNVIFFIQNCFKCQANNNNNNTAIGLSPGGSGYFTCIQNMKLVTNKFKSGGLHEKTLHNNPTSVRKAVTVMYK